MSSSTAARPVRPLSALQAEAIGGLTLRLLPVPRRYRVTLLHETLAPRQSTPTIHHKVTSEYVFVLRGDATAWLGDRRFRVRSGDLFEIAPGVDHTFVAGRRGVRVLSVFSPPLNPKKHDVHPGRDPRTGEVFRTRALKRKRIR